MTTSNVKSLRILSIGIICFFWLADTLLNVYILENGQTFTASLISPSITELWMRLSIIVSVILFFTYAKKAISEQQEQINELEFLVTTDPSTLLINKRKFHELLEYEIEKSKRYKHDLSIIFCNIDNIVELNKEHPKDVIEDFLRTFALQLVTILRKSDIVSRWGEEGFVILIPSKTAPEAKWIAEKIRAIIEKYDFYDVGHISSSFGVTQYVENDNKISIVQRANDAFNQAINNGKISVEVI